MLELKITLTLVSVMSIVILALYLTGRKTLALKLLKESAEFAEWFYFESGPSGLKLLNWETSKTRLGSGCYYRRKIGEVMECEEINIVFYG